MGGGSVSPEGASKHDPGAAVTLTARWTDATHLFLGWAGDCSGTEPSCTLTMGADKTVLANFKQRCSSADHPGCVVAVCEGAPDEYETVAEIPDSALITPDAEGPYHVRQCRQVTVVATASLPQGATRFELRARILLSWPPAPDPHLPAVAHVGATYTFTVVNSFEGAFPFTLDLAATSRRLMPGFVENLTAPRYVVFVWGVLRGITGRDGVRPLI